MGTARFIGREGNESSDEETSGGANVSGEVEGKRGEEACKRDTRARDKFESDLGLSAP